MANEEKFFVVDVDRHTTNVEENVLFMEDGYWVVKAHSEQDAVNKVAALKCFVSAEPADESYIEEFNDTARTLAMLDDMVRAEAMGRD